MDSIPPPRNRRISTPKNTFLQALEIFQDRLSYTSTMVFVAKFEKILLPGFVLKVQAFYFVYLPVCRCIQQCSKTLTLSFQLPELQLFEESDTVISCILSGYFYFLLFFTLYSLSSWQMVVEKSILFHQHYLKKLQKRHLINTC